MTCTTHHHACDCREAEFAALRAKLAEAVARIAFMDIEAGGRQNDIEELTIELDQTVAKLKRSARSAGRYAVRSARLREDRDRWREIVAKRGCSSYDHAPYAANPCYVCTAKAEIAEEGKP